MEGQKRENDTRARKHLYMAGGKRPKVCIGALLSIEPKPPFALRLSVAQSTTPASTQLHVRTYLCQCVVAAPVLQGHVDCTEFTSAAAHVIHRARAGEEPARDSEIPAECLNDTIITGGRDVREGRSHAGIRVASCFGSRANIFSQGHLQLHIVQEPKACELIENAARKARRTALEVPGKNHEYRLSAHMPCLLA